MMYLRAEDDQDNDAQNQQVTAERLSDISLFKNRTIPVFGEVDMELARQVTGQLLAMSETSEAPIRIILNSPGGHVESGDSIHDVIRFVRAPVHILGTGWVASAGVHILLGATPERRKCLPNTRFMIHQPSGGSSGRAVDVEIEAQQILRMRDRLNQVIARETGQPVERVAKDTNRNHWMDAQEAQKYGLISGIVLAWSEWT